MGSKILISGGSGLVGSYLSELLALEGYEVVHLSRQRHNKGIYHTFLWDIDQEYIEEGAFEGVECIVHLAGAGVADKRWTQDRKKLLTSSRVDSANLIHQYLKKGSHQVSSFISASAIGIYGFDTGAILQSEDRTQLGDDFLASLTKKWEAAADQFQDLGLRVVKLRLGLVLSDKGGLLARLRPLSGLGLGAALGDGEQYMSWIHIQDLARLILKAVRSKEMSGVYNAVAPNPVSNEEFMKQLASTLGKPYFMPHIPKFALRIVLGELASVVAGGNRVSSEKIVSSGFSFRFTDLKAAIDHLLKH
ncbi:MAG: TIGR01777 family protein [Cyclobacteriaceae bacterium]|nr:TIGR01777 family protein [Cyclobacteriaceae bacterium]